MNDTKSVFGSMNGYLILGPGIEQPDFSVRISINATNWRRFLRASLFTSFIILLPLQRTRPLLCRAQSADTSRGLECSDIQRTCRYFFGSLGSFPASNFAWQGCCPKMLINRPWRP